MNSTPRRANRSGPFQSLWRAAQTCDVNRDFIRRLIAEKKIIARKSKIFGTQGRWQVDMKSLISYLRRHNYQVPDQPAQNTTIVVIGSPVTWVGEFSELLPPGVRAVYAGGIFDAGVAFERDRPQLAIVDSVLGRSEAIAIGRRFKKADIDCLVLSNEDDDDAIWLDTFPLVIQKPTSPKPVRNALLELAGII